MFSCQHLQRRDLLHLLLQELEAKNHALHELRLAHLSEDRDTATLRLEVDRLKTLQPLLDGGLLHSHAACGHALSRHLAAACMPAAASAALRAALTAAWRCLPQHGRHEAGGVQQGVPGLPAHPAPVGVT